LPCQKLSGFYPQKVPAELSWVSAIIGLVLSKVNPPMLLEVVQASQSLKFDVKEMDWLSQCKKCG